MVPFQEANKETIFTFIVHLFTMNFDTNIHQSITCDPNLYLENSSLTDLGSGSVLGYSSSNQILPDLDQFTMQQHQPQPQHHQLIYSSNPIQMAPNSVYNPYDQFPAPSSGYPSAANQFTEDLLLNLPPGPFALDLQAERSMHGLERAEIPSFPSESSLESLDQQMPQVSFPLNNLSVAFALENGAERSMHGFQRSGLLSFPSESSLESLESSMPLNLKLDLDGFSNCLSSEGENKDQENNSTKKMKKKNRSMTESSQLKIQCPSVKGQWTSEEDRVLLEMIEQYGERKWAKIAEKLPGRIGKQCRERWHNHLRPDIKKDRWTNEEDMILIEAHKEMGNRWSEIAKKLPGRTENTVKNHWNATKRKQLSLRRCYAPRTRSILQDYIESIFPAPADANHQQNTATLSDWSNPEIADDTMSNSPHHQCQNSDNKPKNDDVLVPTIEHNDENDLEYGSVADGEHHGFLDAGFWFSGGVSGGESEGYYGPNQV